MVICGMCGVDITLDQKGRKEMKKTIAILLALCLCIGLCACGEKSEPAKPTKSTEAQKADDLILAIGEVTADSDSLILAAQVYYDTLTDKQKLEVEHYDQLLNAQKLLPQKKVAKLMEEGDYLAASTVVYDNPEIENYSDLVKACGEKVVQQYVKTNGQEKEDGEYFINLVDDDGTEISLWYSEFLGTVSVLRYSTAYGTADGMSINYTPGNDEMLFSRMTSSWGTETNSQEGTVSLSAYTGTCTGSLAENDPEPLIIHGLTVTASKTIYDSISRGYQQATMSYINEMVEALYAAITKAGYKGTIADIGFTAYVTE